MSPFQTLERQLAREMYRAGWLAGWVGKQWMLGTMNLPGCRQSQLQSMQSQAYNENKAPCSQSRERITKATATHDLSFPLWCFVFAL